MVERVHLVYEREQPRYKSKAYLGFAVALLVAAGLVVNVFLHHNAELRVTGPTSQHCYVGTCMVASYPLIVLHVLTEFGFGVLFILPIWRSHFSDAVSSHA